ncbi:dihydroorotase [Ascidiimonas aurantiaca]|uniref:dihydroorotase n=1 Tax=Ascidiimonas aurantiaca TaxID=1685432 RepID=UPI0030ECC424
MNILLTSVRIIDPGSKHHQTEKDIFIENGFITRITEPNSIASNDNYTILTIPNLHVSRGWFDSGVSFGEPGYESRENIANGLRTAAASGFTNVAVNPNTLPVIDTKADVLFIKTRSLQNAVTVHPIGALTQGGKGTHLAELYDMYNAGAVAFYDYQKPVKNPNLLKIAFQYARGFDGLVYSFPQDHNIAGKGLVNEEVAATSLGLKGIPSIAEELQIVRDLFILEYTHGKLHIPTISTARSVDLIRNAKKKGLNVSCSVSVHHLCFTDEVLASFDTHFKVLPPLRTQNDIEALKKGIKDGTIDMVTTDHNPLDVEHKKVEFDYALYGTIGLESAFGMLNKVLGTETAIRLLTSGKKRFNIPSPPIAINTEACLTLFDPNPEYTFSESMIQSSSHNSAFLGQLCKGKALGIIAGKELVLNS